MKIFNKNISCNVTPFVKGESFLLGIHNWDGISECCGEEVNITEIGFGFFKINIAIE